MWITSRTGYSELRRFTKRESAPLASKSSRISAMAALTMRPRSDARRWFARRSSLAASKRVRSESVQ